MRSRIFLVLLSLVFIAGCASRPDDRIRQNPQLFSQLPPDVQQRIRAGQIDIGYTAEMVYLALGNPTRRLDRIDRQGQSEVWMYSRQSSQPRFSFGVGMGSYGRHSAFGTSISTSTYDYRDDEAMRVEFQQGRVVRIDYRRG
jgi:hypothetical protein